VSDIFRTGQGDTKGTVCVLCSYPTFSDSLRDLDDALSLIVLFSNLPASPTVPASIIENCARLSAQWQLYVMRTRSLRKVFLSIKGVYFQAEVKGETVTWLVPYQFTQHVRVVENNSGLFRGLS
jgi:pescadillo protein